MIKIPRHDPRNANRSSDRDLEVRFIYLLEEFHISISRRSTSVQRASTAIDHSGRRTVR